MSELSRDISTPPSTNCRELFKPLNSDLIPCKGLGLSAFEEDIQISFLLANFLVGTDNSSPWLMLHAKDHLPCARMSIRALSAVYFGRVHHLHKTTTQGFEYYIEALKNLNHSLRQSEDASSITVVKSAIVLELYEVSYNFNAIVTRSQTV